jgi:hypothetical protein
MNPDVQCITLIFDMNGFSMSNMVIYYIINYFSTQNLIWGLILKQNVFFPRGDPS